MTGTMPADKAGTVLLYVVAASVAAISLVYIFGPTLFPEDERSRSKTYAGAVGLVNLANDCFINSVLQALGGSKDLKAFLDREVDIRKHGENSSKYDVSSEGGENESIDPQALNRAEALTSGVVTRGLKDILHTLSTRSERYRRTVSAKDFIRTMECAFGRMINRRQQDAQEFLQIVIERLSDEHQARIKVENSTKETLNTNNDIRDAVGNEVPFDGKTTSQIQCLTCHYKPLPIVTSFSMLSLNVPQRSITTIDACLDAMLKLEVIEEYKCLRCTASNAIGNMPRNLVKTDLASLSLPESHAIMMPTPSSVSELDDEHLEMICKTTSAPSVTRRINRHTYISEYPRLLLLHLSRSVFDASASVKNNAKVSFPEVLTLGGFEPRTFRLASLITHRGSHDSGHYETFRRQTQPESNTAQSGQKIKRAGRNKWWRISDERIAECTTQDVLDMQKEAYLLFYEWMET